jgi:hypothetical protein
MAITLVVEDGTGLANANTYISLADSDSYHNDRFNEGWKGGEEPRESALIRATEFIDNEWVFQGDRRFPETPQALAWPRVGVYDEEAQLVDDDSVPLGIQYATAELALVVTCNGTLLVAYAEAAVKRRRERVGVVESEMEFDADETSIFFPRVHQLLAPFVAAKRSGGGSSPLLRG